MKTTLLFILITSISIAQKKVETKSFREFYFLNHELDLTKFKNFSLPEVLRYPNKFVFKNQVERGEASNLFIQPSFHSLDDNFQDLFEVEYLQGRIVSISFVNSPITITDNRDRTKLNFFYDKKGDFKKCIIDLHSNMMQSYFPFFDRCYSPTIDYLCDNSGRIIKSRFIGGPLYFYNEFITTTTYDKNSNIVKTIKVGGRESDYDSFGETEFEFDSQNNKIKETFDIKYLKDTMVLSKKWEYNNQNQCLKEIWFSKNNAIRFLKKYDYKEGKLVSDSIFWGMESDTAKFNNLRLAQEIKYLYDANGRLQAELINHSDFLNIYYYDETGKLIKQEDSYAKYEYDIDGNRIRKYASSVIYDAKNRLVNYTTNEGYSTQSCSIVYLKDESVLIKNSKNSSITQNFQDTLNHAENSSTIKNELFDRNGNMIKCYINSNYQSTSSDTTYFEYDSYSFEQQNQFNSLNQLIEQDWFDEKNKLFFKRKYKYDEIGNWIECSEVSLEELNKAFRLTRKYDQFNNLIEQNIFDDKNELLISSKWKFDKNNFLLEFSQFDKHNKPLDNDFGFQKVIYSSLQVENLLDAKYYNAQGKEVFNSSATHWQYYK
jgi:hypothetical protein